MGVPALGEVEQLKIVDLQGRRAGEVSVEEPGPLCAGASANRSSCCPTKAPTADPPVPLAA